MYCYIFIIQQYVQCEKCDDVLDITASVYLEPLSYIACGLSSGDIIVGLVHHFISHALFKSNGELIAFIEV